MSSFNTTSSLVKYQLPEFIRAEHPTFVEFLQKYYEYLEQPGNAVYELRRFHQNYDVDSARDDMLTYFKKMILPSFPEKTELSTERIIKASRDFYSKKGTPESFKFLFRVLYNEDLEIYFPKLQILRASDGKWMQPKAFRLSISPQNSSFDIKILKNHKAYGSISKATCLIEEANMTIDKGTGAEIAEIYVSTVNRLFQNGEYLEVDYIDENGITQTFSEKIIGALSNIKINPNRQGTKYNTGDPVVIDGGLDPLSLTAVRGSAVVGNVTTGSIESISVINGGYYFRSEPDSVIDIINYVNPENLQEDLGVGAKAYVSAVSATGSISIPFNTDSILYKKNITLSDADFDFSSYALANTNTTLQDALTFESITLSSLETINVLRDGSNFKNPPALNVISLYNTDYYIDEGLIAIPNGSHSNYNNNKQNPSIVFGSGFSTETNYYQGWRISLEYHSRKIISYHGPTRTAYLDRPFEVTWTPSNILSKTLYLDSRQNIQSMGRIAAVQILNGGTGYSASDVVKFIGTGYGAAPTITVTSGAITAISFPNLASRGEGYVVPPDVVIKNSSGGASSGTGAVFHVVLFSDGEELNAVTGSIGKIKDIVLLNRGSDYVTTPNVSLKIYDLKVVPDSLDINQDDIVYQGANVNSTTFIAKVDEYYPANNVLRVFNYSGIPVVGSNLVVYKAQTSNINAAVVSQNVNGKVYPYKYGDGRAKANAEFLNGLIKYNGFYLNTDGQPSSDKKLQDMYKYHNYSYALESKASYADYGKTIRDVAHPAGTEMIPIHLIENNPVVFERANINTSTLIISSNIFIGSCNVGFNSNAVIGVYENFDIVANTNDVIIINSNNSERKFAKTITGIANNNYLTIESPCTLIGQGRAVSTLGSSSIQISGNTNTISSLVNTDDKLKINTIGVCYANLTVGAGNTTTSINLSGIYSSQNTISNFYNGMELQIVEGTGASGAVNTSTITAYNSTTKIATLSPALSVAPAATSKAKITGTIYKDVLSVSGNTITLNSSIGMSSNTNLMYEILPKLNVVDYIIIRSDHIGD